MNASSDPRIPPVGPERERIEPSTAPAPVADAPRVTGGGDVVARGAPRRFGGKVWLAILAGILLLGSGVRYLAGGDEGANAAPAPATEQEHPNYGKHPERGKPIRPVVLGEDDEDRLATRQGVYRARNGLDLPVADVAPATVPAPVREAIARKEMVFISLHFRDTCDEDGDVISVRLDNGMVFGPFPITHAGRTLLIPVDVNRPSRMVIRAERDGVGGITLGIASSEGLSFCERLPEGTEREIPLLVRW